MVARAGIAKPVERIGEAAGLLGDGGEVCAERTGLVEVDVALHALQQASTTIRAATEK